MSKKVAINFVMDGEVVHLAMVQRSASFAEIRQLWREASVDVGTAVYFLVESSDGAILSEEGSLSDLVPPAKPVLVLHVFREEEKSVRVLGSEREPVGIRLQPHETVDQLARRAKGLFGVEDRVARLMVGGRVLDAEAPASRQLVDCPMIELDLLCSFITVSLEPASRPDPDEQADAAEEAAAGLKPPALGSSLEVQTLSRFASEPARTLCGGGESRVTATGSAKSLQGNSVLFALIPEDDLLSGKPVTVFLEQPISVFVEDKICGECGTQLLWPTTKVRELLSCSSDSVIVGGEEADKDKSLWETGLPELGCLTITRTDTLSVLVDGSRRKMKADLCDSLGSLRKQLELPRSEFRLWCDGELLRQDRRSLLQLGVDRTSRLSAVPRSRTVFLKLRDADPVALGEVRLTVTFSEFMKKAAAALKMHIPLKTRFVCECGRIFSIESAERRRLPRRCCDSEDLHMRVFQPPVGEYRSDVCVLGVVGGMWD